MTAPDGSPCATVRLFMDGDAWCALAGDDIQSGEAGFGPTPADALRALALDVDLTEWPLHPTPRQAMAGEGR